MVMAGGCPVALPSWWSVTHQGTPPFVAEKIFQKQLSQRGPIFVLNDEKTPPEKLIMGARSLVQGPLFMGVRNLDGIDMLAVSTRAHAAPRCFVSKRCQQTIFASQASNRIDVAKMHRKWRSILVYMAVESCAINIPDYDDTAPEIQLFSDAYRNECCMVNIW